MIDSPTGLEDRMAALVEQKDVSRERRRFGTATLVGVAVLAALVPAVSELAKSAHESGFTGYLSLAVSDASNLSDHAGDYALSLVDSLPALALSLVLASLALFTWASVASAKAVRRSRLGKLTPSH